MASKSDPFDAIEPGEYILMRGGYGGIVKFLWGGIFGGLAVVFVIMGIVLSIKGNMKTADMVSMLVLTPLMAIIAVVPWLRSGRYRLTNRALSFKPTIGKVKEVALTDIKRLEDVGENKQGMTVITPAGKIKLRSISRWQRLWGALVLYRVPGMADALPEQMGPVKHLVIRGMRQTGRGRFGQGTLVLRPERGWYLPDGADGNALREAMSALAQSKVTIRAQLPTKEYVSRLANVGDANFDHVVGRLCTRLGGQELKPGELPGKVWPMKVYKKRTRVRLREGMKLIQGSCPTAMATPQRDWLGKWGELA